MLPLDEGFIPGLPELGAAAQPGHPPAESPSLSPGRAPRQCHCHPAVSAAVQEQEERGKNGKGDGRWEQRGCWALGSGRVVTLRRASPSPPLLIFSFFFFTFFSLFFSSFFPFLFSFVSLIIFPSSFLFSFTFSHFSLFLFLIFLLLSFSLFIFLPLFPYSSSSPSPFPLHFLSLSSRYFLSS